MTIDKKLINQIIKVSSKAAYASSLLVGKNDKIAADKAAVDAMRTELNSLDINGKVVIGEGELDEAPMLYIGEALGTKNGPNIDIAVDPVEGTNFAANNLPGALSVISIAEKGNLFHAPETYMNKIAAKVNDKNIVDLDFDIKTNLNNLSQYKNKNLEDLIVCILDRPRHKKIIDEIHNLGAKTKLITDGDVAGALLVTDIKFKVDLFLGIGGGPEGVLAASALDAYGCYFQGRLIFENDNDKKRATDMGIKDHDKKYSLNEIVSGDSIFCATGITSGDLVKGISIKDKKFKSQTLITHKSSNTKEIISKVFDIE
ncbi:class II fructose-bisphosphatase [Candidatus Pelagibacter sp.]|uniref:class II fructose-bisphosphatase n=1 Tax=Candidatus Pelagibacter sp. TaxID=2024849 RepID=UPI003F87743D